MPSKLQEPALKKYIPLAVVVVLALVGGAISWTLLNEQNQLREAQEEIDRINSENNELGL